MTTHTVKRSNWDCGSICVPAAPTGFSVAITVKGAGTGWVTPSTVTVPSSMTSNSADWVRLEVRLISSPKNRLHITLPGWYTSRPVSFWNTVKPTMSKGSTSGVNCTRLSFSSSARAKASASVVLPTPGMSSISTWPPASMAIQMVRMVCGLPNTALETSAATSAAFWLYCMVIPPGVFARSPARRHRRQ